MSSSEPSLSPSTLERIVARAIELDEENAERIGLASARAIAAELGISAAAWDAAVSEHLTRNGRRVRRARPRRWSQAAAVAFGSGMLGALLGLLHHAWPPDFDVIASLGLIAAALGLGVYHLRRRSLDEYQVQVAALWIGFPLGVGLGHGDFLLDPFWLAATAWAVCAAAGALAELRSEAMRPVNRL